MGAWHVSGLVRVFVILGRFEFHLVAAGHARYEISRVSGGEGGLNN